MKTPGSSASGLFFKSAQSSPRIESLESRIAPAFTSVLAGTTATLTGDGASDALSFATENGLLKHNRFTAGDAGFTSDLDFDSTAAGVQTLAADPTSVVSIALGGGGDSVHLGSDLRASLLRAKFSIANTGPSTGSVTVDDSASTAVFEYIVAGGIMPPTDANLVLSGDLLSTLAIGTGSGADRVSVSGQLANSTTVTTNAGNDVVLGSNSTLNPMVIFGGAGDDFLQGGGGADVIFGEDGADTIVGLRGNDILFGQNGPDTFTWAPGENSDTIEGGLGVDALLFTGANVGEIFDFSANGGRLLMFRNVANIVMDLNDVEAVELDALGGADTITINDLTPTDVKSIRVNLAAFGGAGDAQTDTLILNGNEVSEDVRVTQSPDTVRVFGLPAYIEFTGAETFDQLTINGNGGSDNLFATEAVRTSMVVTLNGETSFNNPIGTTLSAPASFDLPKNPSAMASGDLFGFGPDLVVVHPKSNSISILINAGDGTFLPPVQLSTGGKTPKSVVLADFNGDGRLDIAVTNSGSANVAIFLNTGTGSFNAPALVSTGRAPGVIRAGDVTGDGEIDLVMITAGNSVTRLAGDGAGNFADPLKISTGGKNPVDFVLADINDDSRLDIAVANAASNTVSLLPANADFTFAPPIVSRVGIKPTGLATGDFNGDGLLDLAVSHAVSRFASVLVNTGSAAVPFNPQIKLSYPGKKIASAIAVGDVDGDERADLILANLGTGSVGVFLGAEDGIFRSAIDFDLDNIPVRKTAAIALADFNSDGRLDIAVSNPGTHDLTVLYQIRTTL